MNKAINEHTLRSEPPLMSGKTALALLGTVAQLKQAAGVTQSSDAEVLQGCDAIMNIYNSYVTSKAPACPETYSAVCRSIEDRAEAIAPIPALSAAGIQAKARVVYALSKIGMACYAARILAASLATDVMARAIPANPDAELIALCAEIDALEDKLDSFTLKGATFEEEQAQDLVARPFADAQEPLIARLCDMSAITIEGIQARARTLVKYAPQWKHNRGGYDCIMISALLRDLIGEAWV